MPPIIVLPTLPLLLRHLLFIFDRSKDFAYSIGQIDLPKASTTIITKTIAAVRCPRQMKICGARNQIKFCIQYNKPDARGGELTRNTIGNNSPSNKAST